MAGTVAPVSSPFLKLPEFGQTKHMIPKGGNRFSEKFMCKQNKPMATRVVDVLVPVALDQAYSYRVPAGMELAPGDLVAVPLGARGETLAWSGPTIPIRIRACTTASRTSTKSSTSRRSSPSCAIRRLGRRLHARLARHGAAHGAAHGRASRARPRTRRRAARRAAAAAHDAGARARAGAVRRWLDARQGRGRAARRASAPA